MSTPESMDARMREHAHGHETSETLTERQDETRDGSLTQQVSPNIRIGL